MSYADRETRIMNVLYEKDAVKSSELARILYVSKSTVRRDLIKLKEKQYIVKTNGYYELSPQLQERRTNYKFRTGTNEESKRKIAKRAVRLVQDDNSIMMDGSSTVCYVAELLGEFKNLTVITNNMQVSSVLCDLNIDNISTGGRMLRKTGIFAGADAIKSLEKYNADIVFFSVRGLTEDGYLTDTLLDTNDIRMEMLRHAKRRVLLIDSSKIGKKYLYNLCHISEIDDIICDTELPKELTRQLRKSKEE